jgi:uncharacterized protein DUF4440
MTCKIVIAVLGLVLTLSPCYAQNRKKDRNETVIKALEGELEAALLKGDSVKLDRILAEDYIEINAQGDVANRAEVISLARARSSLPPLKSVGPEKTVDDFSIRLHGDSALVMGRTTTRYQFMEYQKTSPATSHFQNPATVDQERFIRTYSRTGGRWQLVAWQTTSIAKR